MSSMRLALLIALSVLAISGCSKDHTSNECPRLCTAWSLTESQRIEQWGSKGLPDEYTWGAPYDSSGLSAFKECAERAERKARAFSRRGCAQHYHRACVEACTKDLQ